MKKLPKIHEFKLSNNIHNNKKVFDSLKDNNLNEIKKNTNKISNNSDSILSVKDKIKKLIQSNNYIFNTEVTLIFEDKEVDCHIAGVVNNHIITMDNEIIKIDDLKDIKY